MQKFLRREDVRAITSLPTSTLYEMMERGEFPRPIRVSRRAVAWLEEEVLEWQKARIAERDGAELAA